MKSICIVILALISAQLMAQNTLTKQEEKDGWKLLFDGTTTKG